MRRRTHEVGKELSDHVIKSNKKYTCQSKTKMASAGQLYHHFKASFDFSYSEIVAKLFLQDLMQLLEIKFRKVEEIKYLSQIIHDVQNMECLISSMNDPISQDSKMKIASLSIQNQPQTAKIQACCGGKMIYYDPKLMPSKRPSISQVGFKDEKKQNYASKQELRSSLSSKCLVRLSKQQKMQRKRSMEALQAQQIQTNDNYDELLKQKIYKQNVLHLETSLFQPNTSTFDNTNSKFSKNLRTIDQCSYDYDSSLIPIKKFTRVFPQKIKILSPICKVNKDAHELKKVKNSNYGYVQSIRNSGEQNILIKLHADINQLNQGRKGSTKQFLNLASAKQNKEELESHMSSTFQDLIKAKSIRIRQIKQ